MHIHRLSHSVTLSKGEFSIKPNSCNFKRFTAHRIPKSVHVTGFHDAFIALIHYFLEKKRKKEKYLNSASLNLF